MFHVGISIQKRKEKISKRIQFRNSHNKIITRELEGSKGSMKCI